MAVGDVEFKGADGAVYVLNFGTNAMCRLEQATGKHYGAVCDELSQPNPSIVLARQFLKASLVDPKDVTDEQAGDVVDAIGGPNQVVSAFRRVYAPIVVPVKGQDG